MLRMTLGRSIALVLGGLALSWVGTSTSGAQPAEGPRLLVGKWYGEIQGAFAGNRARVLVISEVREGAAEGRFGLSDDRLRRIPIIVHQTATEVTLDFTVRPQETVHIPWRLKLVSPGVLVGTVYQPVRGAPGRVEYPVTFKKAE